MKPFTLVFLLAAAAASVSSYHHSYDNYYHLYDDDYHHKSMMSYKNYDAMEYDGDHSISPEFIEAFRKLHSYGSLLKDVEFNKRAQYFADHYFKYYYGEPHNYDEYRGSDIAYHPGLKAAYKAGLKSAYEAYKHWMRSYYPKQYSEYYRYPSKMETPEAYTPEQVFMISYVNMYYSKYQPKTYYGKSYTPAPRHRGYGPVLYMPEDYHYQDYFYY